MKIAPIFLFMLLMLVAPPQTHAQNDDLVYRDTIYYTLDDGVMSPKEMEAEANDVYRLCDMNPYQKTFINCECLAGAFLIQREKSGPVMPQFEILNAIAKNKGANCANTEEVAGKTYTSCMDFANAYRELERDNPEYCECVANRVAQHFTRTPVLEPDYISDLNVEAMGFCASPQNRKTASSE
jgi:hypothetical protein